MSRKRGRPNKSGPDFAATVPLRIPGDMQEHVRKVSQKARLSDADIMRLAIERGLGAVEQMFETPTKQVA